MLGISFFPSYSPSTANICSNMASEYESVLIPTSSSSSFNDLLFEDTLLDIGVPKFNPKFFQQPILRRACSSAPELGTANRILDAVNGLRLSDSEISLQDYTSLVKNDRSSGHGKSRSDRLPRSCRANNKKNVSFADDCGYSLVSIYILHESSDTPPTLNNKRLVALSNAASFETDGPESWNLRMQFAQPITEFVLFHEQLSKGKVALERVFLDEFKIQGTVRVCNLSFNKKVFARFTTDCWKTFIDYNAEYMSSDAITNCDVFRFVLEITINKLDMVHQDIAFAVCFECDIGQFWDNNRGENYRLLIDNNTTSDSQHNAYTKDGKPNFLKYNSSNFSTFNASSHFDGENCYY